MAISRPPVLKIPGFGVQIPGGLLEGGATWVATGLENRAMLLHEGSTPSPSATVDWQNGIALGCYPRVRKGMEVRVLHLPNVGAARQPRREMDPERDNCPGFRPGC